MGARTASPRTARIPNGLTSHTHRPSVRRSGRTPAAREKGNSASGSKALPRLWAVQVRPGARGWFERALLKRVRKDGINALTLKISALGPKAAGRRTFERVRAFASAEKLYLVAVLSAGKSRTPAGRRALALCSRSPSSRVRCAVQAPSEAAAAALAREADSVRQLVALYVSSPRRIAPLAGLPASLSRRILVIAPLHRQFNAAAWGVAIGLTAASPSVYMGAAPETRASRAVRQLAATVAGAGRKPPSTPTKLAASSTGPTSITLSWRASTDIVGVSGYRMFRDGTLVGTSASTSFSFTGLACGTSYRLGVAAYDAAGKASGTASTTQSTSACADTQPPSTPTGLVTSGVGETSVTLSWNASADNVGVTGYRLFVNGIQVGTSSTTSYLFSGLSCQTAYTLGVAAVDAAGNLSSVAMVIAQTADCSDTQPPSTPSGLATGSVTQTSMKLSWNASTDNVGVAGYRLFLNGSQVGSSASTSYSFAGLACGTSYALGVAAYDAAGNVSGTATLSNSTSACSDTQPPSTPTGLVTSAVAQTSVALSWNASTDNVGVAGYRLFLNGTQVGTSTSTNFSFTGLSCGTSYTLGVAAYDSAGNVSGTATTSQSTNTCASGLLANIFVSPTGNDAGANCKRYPTAQADPGGVVCLTFAKACSLAQAGDVVGVRSGTYAPQQLSSSDCPHASSAAPITFEPSYTTAAVPNAGAASDAPLLGGTCSAGCTGLVLEGGSGAFGDGGSGTGAPSYLTFVNFNVQGSVEMAGNQGEVGTGTQGVNLVLEHLTTGAINDVGVTNELVEYSSFGPCYNPNDWSNKPCEQENSNDWSLAGAGGGRQESSGMFTNDIFHDYHNGATNTGNGNDHSECYFALDWRQLTIQDSQFYNCEISGGIRIERIVTPGSNDLLTIQNNWFGQTIYGDGGDQECEDVTWGDNSGALSNVLIRYNTFSDGGGPSGSSGSPTSSFRIVANLIGLDPGASCESATPATGHYGSAVASYNVWVGSNYGTNSAHVASDSAFNALLVNPAGDSSMDYHLANSTSLPNNYVPCSTGDAHLTTDYDGDPRPQNGPNCDAGSDEH